MHVGIYTPADNFWELFHYHRQTRDCKYNVTVGRDNKQVEVYCEMTRNRRMDGCIIM